MFLLIFVVVVFFFFYYKGIRPYSYWKNKGVPHLKPLPFVGNVADNFARRKSFAELLYDLYAAFPNKRYMGFYQYEAPTLLLRDPELIKTITVKEFDTFPAHWLFAPEDVDPLWGKNLFALVDKTRWREMRTALSPSFTSSKMRVMFELIKECAKQYSKFYLKHGGTVTVEFKDSFRRFTNDVIATTAFGVTCNSLENPENDFFLMGCEATDFSGLNGLRFFLSAISPTIMKVLNIGIYNRRVSKFFRGIIKSTIRLREDNEIYRPDLINQLLEFRRRCESDTKGNTKTELTDDDITAQALIFFFAGFDTVSSTLCFTIYELALNHDIQAKLQVEVDTTLEMCKGDFTYEAIIGMNYLDMVVNESLRKWPPTISTDRISVAPYTLQPEHPDEESIHLDSGTNCWIPIFAIHRDEKFYPNPQKFDPERFNDQNKKSLNHLAYLPFGIGPRVCIGARFALLECKLIVAEIISKFEIVVVQQTQIPLKLHTSNFPLLAENGFWLGLKPRRKQNLDC